MLAARYDLEHIDGFDASMLTRVIGRQVADRDRRAPVEPPRRTRPPTVGRPCPAAVLLLPGPQRGGQPRGPRRRGARDAADARRDVRDHRRRRRLDATERPRSPTTSPRPHPDVVRVVHHPVNLGYGAALRSGFGAARYELDRVHRRRPPVPGRRPRPAHRAPRARPISPDVVVGFRIKRADPLVRIVYARAYRLANRIFFGLQVTRRRLRLQAVPARGARGRRGRVGRRVLLGRAADQAAGRGPDGRRGRRARTIPRTAGSPTGAKPQVIFRAVRDFWRLRLRLWVEPRAGAPPRTADRQRADAAGLARPAALARPASASSELTNSRNTSSRGSTTPSPVASSGVPRRASSLVARSAARPSEGGLVQHRGRREDPARRIRTASASASDGRASTSTHLAVPLEHDPWRGTSRRPGR